LSSSMKSLLCALVLATACVAAPPGKRQATATTSGSAAASSLAVSTAVASVASPSAIESKRPAPRKQPTCDSLLFCPGPILQAVQLAGLYVDSKTFVDKPARYPTDQIVSAFNNITSNGTYTYGQIEAFVEENFLGEGLNIEAATIPNFNPNPAFLQNISDPVVRGWLQIVHGYWASLARNNVVDSACAECESTLIPLNHTFVVPGGRFREIYYWDTYWILEGLLKGGINDISRNIIENFMDQLELFGFIPNGGRTYYLNRSQPPVFTQMLWLYIESTGDRSLLSRALPLIETELQWWQTNRTSEVTSQGKTHRLARYAVQNSAPRPEGYLEDFETVYGAPGEASPGFSNATAANLFANLASGAESGQDYSAARWSTNPYSSTPLRTLNTNAIVPVDLNSILYNNMRLLSKMYELSGNTINSSKSSQWAQMAAERRQSVIDLCWNEDLSTFYDFNTTSNQQIIRWTPTSYYAYWSHLYPDSMLSSQAKAQDAFKALGYVIANYNGTVPASLITTGQQWDAPNAWPPHTYIAIKALENLPSNLTTGSFANFSSSVLDYSSFIANQTGLSRSQLPKQSIIGTNGQQDTNITSVTSFDQLGHVGNSTSNTSWSEGLAVAIANRYISSAYCSWHSTGGSIPGLVSQVSTAELNATNSVGNTGNMFEKFSLLDIDQGGSGGEYQVVVGFGWTNGVAIYLGATMGDRLSEPVCPPIVLEDGTTPSRRLARRRLAERF